MIFNVMSIVFGAIAIIFPIIALIAKKRQSYKEGNVNMKKFRHILLSCVLAVGMLNLTVWAQDQSEPPQITAFLEKVGVKLPEEAGITDYSVPVKKSEFVWLVVEALDKNAHVQKQYLTFSDVKLDDWFHDNVIFGADISLVAGRGDGSFGTNDLLDENTAGIIMMRALGFENLIQTYGIQDISGVYSGRYSKLFKNTEKDGTVTVGEAYQMIYNMLQSDYVAMDIDGTYHIVTDQPYMTTVFDIEKYSGRVTGNQYTQLGLDGAGCGDSCIEIDGVEYKSEMENPEKYLGYYVDYFVNNQDQNEPVVLDVIPRRNNEVTVIESSDVEKLERDGKYLVFHYNNGSVRNKIFRVPSTADFVYNGKTANLSEELLNKLIDEQFGTIKISCISFSFCTLSLYCQICEYNRRVGMQDWTALLDTSEFMLGISFALMIVTMVLNLILFKKTTRK